MRGDFKDKMSVASMNIAIEFAKHLMDKEVERCYGMDFNGNLVVISGVPPEFKLMKGDLILNGTKLFSEFAINKLVEKYE